MIAWMDARMDEENYFSEDVLLDPKSNQKSNLTYFNITKCNKKIILGQKIKANKKIIMKWSTILVFFNCIILLIFSYTSFYYIPLLNNYIVL